MHDYIFESTSMITQWVPIWRWTDMYEYNCSRVLPIGKQWTLERGEPCPLVGWWSILWGCVCQAIYIPCSIALYLERSRPCYRIMLWLTIVDIIALMCNSIAFGFLIIEGVVFCSCPWLVWIIGCLALGTWCGACSGCLLLVVYRLFELLDMRLRFEAHVNILLVIATFYTLFISFFTPPLLTNSKHAAMLYDPFIGDIPTESYVNWIHTVNNLLIVTSSAALYVILIAVLLTKQKVAERENLFRKLIIRLENQGLMSSEAEKLNMSVNAPIFIQASLICVLNVTASLINIYMNFFETGQFLNQIAHISWQITHGMPPIIYLTLNKTVKRHCRNFLLRKIRFCCSCFSRKSAIEDTNNDRVTIEWTNTPDGAAKQFRREWFQGDGMVRRKNLPIEYNP